MRAFLLLSIFLLLWLTACGHLGSAVTDKRGNEAWNAVKQNIEGYNKYRTHSTDTVAPEDDPETHIERLAEDRYKIRSWTITDDKGDPNTVGTPTPSRTKQYWEAELTYQGDGTWSIFRVPYKTIKAP